MKSKHRDVKASAVNRTPVPNIIDPGNDISVQDIELMELTHDVAFSQYSDLLPISDDDDDQPPIKKSAKPKISKDTFNCTDCEVQTSSKFKLNGHQKRKHLMPRTNQRGGGQLDLLTNICFKMLSHQVPVKHNHSNNNNKRLTPNLKKIFLNDLKFSIP